MRKKPERTELSAKLMDAWYEWYKVRNGGVPPMVTKISGDASKRLATYLYSVAKEKNGHLSDDILNDGALGILEYILNKWDSITDNYIHRNIKLEQITSNITNIINDFRNGKHRKERGRPVNVADAFAKIDNSFGKPE